MEFLTKTPIPWPRRYFEMILENGEALIIAIRKRKITILNKIPAVFNIASNTTL